MFNVIKIYFYRAHFILKNQRQFYMSYYQLCLFNIIERSNYKVHCLYCQHMQLYKRKKHQLTELVYYNSLVKAFLRVLRFLSNQTAYN